MRILVLAPRFPWPPDKGDRLTIFNYLRCLSKEHQLALACFVEHESPEDLGRVSEYLEAHAYVRKARWDGALRCAVAMASRKPFQQAYYESWEMEARVEELVRQFKPDIIYCHTIRMAPYALRHPEVPNLLGMQISMALNYRRLVERSSSLALRLFYGEELRRVRPWEVALARKFDATVVISRTDLEEMVKSGASVRERLHVMAHGVDAEHFHPGDGSVEVRPGSIVMTGNMAYPPNGDAVQYMVGEILPLVVEKVPGVEFWIVGKNPDTSTLALHNGKTVHVTGEVADTRPYLWQSEVAVVPVRVAAGLQNKLLEALACGMPTVATPEANEGIGARDGHELLIGSTPEGFAAAVVKLLQDGSTAREMGLAGRQFIEREFTWEYFLGHLVGLMEQVVAGADPARH